MIGTLTYVLKVVGLATLSTLVVIVVGWVVYLYGFKDWMDYQKAKGEIFAFVKGYKRRCTGNNRFVVTSTTLQDSFREYETSIIEKVWLDLIQERIIELDPQDNVWCVR